jgi:small subunit ribosomal protein S14
MAKKSMIEREKKRRILVARYAKKREIIKNEIKKLKNSTSFQNLLEIQGKLQKFPRNSSPIRLRNRCWKTGKPRGYFRFFGLCRNAVRELAHNCVFPGITKSSW